MRRNVCAALLLLTIIGSSSIGQAEEIEVAPGVVITRTIYSVTLNEAPFFNFAQKTASQKEADDKFVAEVLKQVPDRSKAAQAASGAGWQALMLGAITGPRPSASTRLFSSTRRRAAYITALPLSRQAAFRILRSPMSFSGSRHA